MLLFYIQIVELKKQSSCSIRLVNKSDHHVAFKVKTTSSSKYCVRPNTGVIKPDLTCDLIGISFVVENFRLCGGSLLICQCH
ncbi:putative major sperm protein (MSP) [Helianthus annuus]|nr:putative major sperm protein (MSP) [Helianthus annuus]